MTVFSKRELIKNKAVEQKLQEGHLALVMHDEKTLKELLPAAQENFWKRRNYIVHLMYTHNALVDASNTLEARQAAAILEVAIDAKIESMDAYLANELDFVRNNSKKRVNGAPKKRAEKFSQAPRAIARRKTRATETKKERAARLAHDRELKAKNRKFILRVRKLEAAELSKTKLRRAKSRAKAA